jgi:hypothetical protein
MMITSGSTKERIIQIRRHPRQHEVIIVAVYPPHTISKHTFCKLRQKYGGVDTQEAYPLLLVQIIAFLLLVNTGCSVQQQPVATTLQTIHINDTPSPLPTSNALVLDPNGSSPVSNPATPFTEASTLTRPTNLPTTPSGPSVTARSQEDWTTYVDNVGGYAISVSSTWTIESLGRGMIAFHDPTAVAGGEDRTVVGGVNILARNMTGRREYIDALPNHSDPLDERPITTLAGLGRLFTLRRDASNQMWVEQHAYFSAGNRFYAIWLKVQTAA